MSERHRLAHAKCMETYTQRSERVEVNLPADTLPLWLKVRDGIKGETGDIRAERFMEYVSQHPAEHIAAMQAAADAKLAKMIRARAERDVEMIDEEVPF